MKYYCIENGCVLESIGNKPPNFCQKCGSPQTSLASKTKIKVKAKIEEEEEDEENDDDGDGVDLDTNIRFVVEGVKDWQNESVIVKNTIGQTTKSERINRRGRGEEQVKMIRAKLQSNESIEIGD